jgi:hypothetical protein
MYLVPGTCDVYTDQLTEPIKLRGDWSYWHGDRFLWYTVKHRIRLLIGLHGVLQDGQYIFKRVRYGSRLHNVLNRFLRRKPVHKSRKYSLYTGN